MRPGRRPCSPGERTRVEASTERERRADGTHHGRLATKARRLADSEYRLDPSTVHTEQIAKTILPQLRSSPRQLIVGGREQMEPTYRGVDAQHTWRVRAVVVVPLGMDVVAEADVTIR